jgi:transposase
MKATTEPVRGLRSWEVSDALWERARRVIPPRKPSVRRWGRRKKPGGGRPPVDDRTVFAGIIYILRTGCQWKAAPQQFGSGSTLHLRFQQWERAGVWRELWRAGVAEYDALEGIAWRWQSADAAMGKARLGGEATGPNPTDRGKKGSEAASSHRRSWGPAFPRRHRGKRE